MFTDFVVHYKSTKIFKMAKTSPNKFQEKNVVTVYDLNNWNFKFEKNLFFPSSWNDPKVYCVLLP